MRNFFILILLVVVGTADAQKLKKDDKETVANLQKHIQFLASDQLEGRRTGTPGEQKAMEYISSEFQKDGLAPKGDNNYYQPFEIYEGKKIDPSTFLTVGGQTLLLNKEFFPFAFSADTTIEALASLAIQELQTPWFFDLKEMVEANAQNPHANFYQAVKEKAKELNKKGATALFFYNTSALNDSLLFNGKDNSEILPIPVVYLTKEAVKKYLNDPSATLDIKLKTNIGDKMRTGNNVIGYLDNNAPTTVVLGAHFDHLGHGEQGTALAPTGNQVYNGADDNASGVAALLELARLLKASGLKQNNYLFIAFSGEEQGLYGSKYFTQHPTIDLSKVNYMINMDMIGRLNDSSHTVTVGGFGTSPSWASAYAVTGRHGLYDNSLSFKFDSSGVGPSDHTSFYLKNIPVLFYFTGVHTDYHKPTDDVNKINYLGELNVLKHIYSLIEWQNKQDNKLTFTKTKENFFSAPDRFSVTLGILPDYTFNGNGVRIDGISENKPAQKAGLQQGDVILQLGNYSVQSLENYMQALSQFKQGDTTTVQFNRGSQKLAAAVAF